MRDIGKNIRLLREKADMTQEAFAEKLFVTRQTVSNYENGRTRPDLEMLIAIAEVLHADVTHILYGIPTPPDKKRLIRQLTAGGIGTALLMVMLVVGQTVRDRFDRGVAFVSPVPLLQFIVAPAAFLALGCTLMQLAVVLGKKPPQKNRCKNVRNILLLILVLYALVVVPFLAWVIWCRWQVLQYGSVQSSFPHIPVYSHILNWTLQNMRGYTTVFLIFLPYGAAIRYFGLSRNENLPNDGRDL